MRQVLAVIKRNLHNMRKSPRVADETMIHQPVGPPELPILAAVDRRSGWNGFSLIYSLVRAPLSLFSCLSHPHINGADGVWVSSELARMSEMNHLMVNDSMRYAILM